MGDPKHESAVAIGTGPLFTPASANVISGVFAGLVSSSLCAPLDVARTRFQVQGTVKGVSKYSGVVSALARIWREESIYGLYKGVTPSLLTVPIFWGIYFTTYDLLKIRLSNSFLMHDEVPPSSISSSSSHSSSSSSPPLSSSSSSTSASPSSSSSSSSLSSSSPSSSSATGDLPWHIHVLAAMGAGFCADVTTNPLWVVRTRMQTEHLHTVANDSKFHYSTIRGSFQTIYAHEGVKGFYKGLTASLLGLSHVAIQFPIYERLKKFSREKHGGSETAMDMVAAAALSKTIGSLVTYPHEVIRSRMQDSRDPKYAPSVFRIGGSLVKEEGMLALYTGFRINLARVLPNCIATFLAYEMLSSYLLDLSFD